MHEILLNLPNLWSLKHVFYVFQYFSRLCVFPFFITFWFFNCKIITGSFFPTIFLFPSFCKLFFAFSIFTFNSTSIWSYSPPSQFCSLFLFALLFLFYFDSCVMHIFSRLLLLQFFFGVTSPFSFLSYSCFHEISIFYLFFLNFLI